MLAKYLSPVSIFLLPISPVLAVFSAFANAFVLKSEKHIKWMLFVFCLALALINYGKRIESDLILYGVQFDLASETNILEYLVFNFKDPLYYAICYLGYHLTNGDFALYLLLLTFLCYHFLFRATLLFAKGIGLPLRYGIFAVILVGLFPQVFSFSGHILRQFLAISVGYYFLARFYYGNSPKSSIVMLFASTLMHSSNLIVLGSAFFKLDVKKLIKVSILLSPVVVAGGILLNSGFVLLNGFKRVNALNSGPELNSISPVVYILLMAMLAIFTISYFGIVNTRNKTVRDIPFARVYTVFNVLFFFAVATGNTELSNRLLPNIYFFFPLILSQFLWSLDVKVKLLFAFASLMLVVFVIALQKSVWTYEKLSLLFFLL